ncbi:MAG: peptidoglycan DD-metalloendopeptidase family protein [Gammaproteobacteria bacterium]
MTYRVYIKKDYKMVVRQIADRPAILRRRAYLAVATGLCIAAGLAIIMPSDKPAVMDTTVVTAEAVAHPEAYYKEAPSTYPTLTENSPVAIVTAVQEPSTESIAADSIAEELHATPWETATVKRGDNLALIFKRLHLSPRDLHHIIALGDETSTLKHMQPGQKLHFLISGGQLDELEYDINLTKPLHVTRLDNGFSAKTTVTELDTRIKKASGVIDSSLFLTAQDSGLSDNLTMQLIALYGWDIDFALDIRKGDRFFVIYEEHYKEGLKVKDGPILAAEFVNQNKPYRAVRYVHKNGHADYYSDSGHNMRKAFLRTPVNFTRISSRFSLKRKHPILNRIRAHKGVDYAAPTGTPIKATGDGVVTFAGRNGGYGKSVILKHGEKYSTVYAHLSRYVRSIKKGKRVEQGQTIGYVGTTGLATGPHLHYEFRIHGVHRNPLTVKLPKALRIPENIMADFKTQTLPLLAQLDVFTGKTEHTASLTLKQSMVALNDDTEKTSSSP